LGNPSYQNYLEFYKYIITKFVNIAPISYQESDLLYAVGDTHGSYNESIIMIKHLTEVIKKKSDVKIIFLGDYVDRNPFDLENLTIICAFYLKYPDNVILLRGNHEDFKINEVYGFIKNLYDNFIIDDRVSELYLTILKLFVNLPVGVVHSMKSIQSPSKKIFLVHGGIPIDLNEPNIPLLLFNIKDTIKNQVESYDQFDNIMNWLLWSDPDETIDDFRIDEKTGRNKFGNKLFNQFMKANDFDLVVRAHEVLTKGYKTCFDGRLITIFSTSYYKSRKIGEGAFLKITSNEKPIPLLINSKILLEELKWDNFLTCNDVFINIHY